MSYHPADTFTDEQHRAWEYADLVREVQRLRRYTEERDVYDVISNRVEGWRGDLPTAAEVVAMLDLDEDE